MSKLKFDNFYQFFYIFDILITSHNKEEVEISREKILQYFIIYNIVKIA